MTKKKRRRDQPRTGVKNNPGSGICSVCSHPQSKEISLTILERKTTLEDLQKLYGIHRSSLSRHARKHLRHKLEENFKQGRLVVPYTDTYTRWPGEKLPASIAARNDVLILSVEYAPARVPWISRDTPAPYPFDSVSMSEIETEIEARKAVEAQEKAALEAQAALAAVFDPVADDPPAEAGPVDPPEVEALTRPAVAPEPPRQAPSPAQQPSVLTWLNYFRPRN